VRATQTLISHMAFCWRHPSLVALEVGWRWLVGIPVLLVAWREWQRILTQVPLATVGWERLEWQNPWASSVILAEAIERYAPLVGQVIRWLVPVAVLGWALVSAVGRILLVRRMLARDESAPLSSMWGKLPGVAALQGLWMVALLACFWCWYRGVGWASATHITVGVQPDLVGYLCWLIFLSLGLYVLWAVTSWTLGMAPLVYLLEGCTWTRALGRSLRLGKELSGKLVEVNLVMAIVKIALIVLAMVLSAAPLPFSDAFGPDFLHALYGVIAVGFLIGNDYFQVVRIRAFVELRKHYVAPNTIEFASSSLINTYPELQLEFMQKILRTERWFVSDESSLWDFTMDESIEPYYVKIKNLYGIDVSDIRDAVIWKILQRIAEQQRQ
jgi:hypothetical protein